MTRVAVVVVLAVLLAGCDPDPTPGVVTDRRAAMAVGVPAYRLAVRHASDGPEVVVQVNRTTYPACLVGARWPDCSDGAK